MSADTAGNCSLDDVDIVVAIDEIDSVQRQMDADMAMACAMQVIDSCQHLVSRGGGGGEILVSPSRNDIIKPFSLFGQFMSIVDALTCAKSINVNILVNSFRGRIRQYYIGGESNGRFLRRSATLNSVKVEPVRTGL